jgi:hypothetical protein
VKARIIMAAAAGMLTLLATTGAAGAVAPHYTDGTQCQGPFCPGGPPPTNPVFADGQQCKTDVIDPPTSTFVTEHFVYSTTPPAAGVVPVADDASAVFAYVGTAPGLFTVDIETYVAGKQGFRADTWNIGKGVTAWVPFNCTPPPTSTTTTTTTVASTTTTTTTVPETTTTISPPPSTTSTSNPCDAFARGVAPNDPRPGAGECGATPAGTLPRTGTGSGLPVAVGGAFLVLGIVAAAAAAARRKAMR